MAYSQTELYNDNMHRNYPFSSGISVYAGSGTDIKFLPESFIVDLKLRTGALAEGTELGTFYVSSINTSGTTFQVIISYRTPTEAEDEDADCIECAAVNAIPSSLEPGGDGWDGHVFAVTPILSADLYTTYPHLVNLSGTMVIGSCADMRGKGTWVFDYAHSKLDSTCVTTFASGIDSVTIQDRYGNTIHTFTSDFAIKAGDGIELTVGTTTVGTSSIPTLEINRVPTDAEKAASITDVESVVSAVMALLGTPIRKINGVSPDSAGNFYIAGGDCTTVTTGQGQISISNPCSVPCCTEATGSEAEAAIQKLDDARERLSAYFEALSTNISMMQSRLSSLIASRQPVVLSVSSDT